MGIPAFFIKPLQDALDAKVAANRQKEDPAKLLKQLTTVQHNTRKQRDAAKAEAEQLWSKLGSLNATVADLDLDLAALQQDIARQVAAQTGAVPKTSKRGGEPPIGFQLLREALDAPGTLLSTPEYIQYKTAQEAKGGSAFCPLLWCLYKVFGPLEEDAANQPQKRHCKATGASGEHMEDVVI